MTAATSSFQMGPQSMPLPELRPELRLIRTAPSASGEPHWIIHDPLQNRYIQIDAIGHYTLSLWPQCRSLDELIDRAGAARRFDVDEASVKELMAFLYRNKLTVLPPRDGWRHFAEERKRSRHSLLQVLLHNYLFFRIPLVKPQVFLERTLWLADILCSRAALGIIGLLGVIGLYLVTRQWDEYTATIPELFTLEGALMIAFSLSLVKTAHELGHAYTAVRHGCHVPTMGIAVMMMAPLLYTDVTDSWRLSDRRKRLRIDSAGVRVELAIAALALFAWSFLPDSTWRGAAFTLSAVSIVTSLAINLNPLMRFDGYYLLSEIVGVENLQPRAFALGRWRLREWLFGLGDPPPENLPRRHTIFLTGYAYAIWVYRFFLFVGIALLVYSYFFKILGIILFAIEIVFFVARPIWSELKVWYSMKARIISSRRGCITLGVAASALVLAAIPWSREVHIPAVVELQSMQPVYAKRRAIIEQIHVGYGQAVNKDQPLVTLSSPDIVHEIALTRSRLALAEVQYARRGADPLDREASLVTADKINSLKAKLEGLEQERNELIVRAPIAGRVLELDPGLNAGRWISPKEMMVLIGDQSRQVLRGYVSESDLWRIEPGTRGRFVAEEIERPPFDVSISEIAVGSSAQLEIPDLASTHQGRIKATPDSAGRLAPASAQYLVRLAPAADTAVAPYEISARGVAVVDGKAESLLAKIWRQSLKVVMRETGA